MKLFLNLFFILFLFSFGKDYKLLYYPTGEYISFNKMIDMFMKADVVYLGEIHSKKEIHDFQLDVIKAIYEREPYIAIAMEMFQAPFQKYLDKYVECEIDEDKMLELTEYKKRWKFDINLYRDIWRFAKENGIRIIAMNIPTELLKEIREKGLENVKSEYLPDKFYEPTDTYKKLLFEALESHKIKDVKRFFDIQMAWDNGMALSLYKAIWSGEYEKIIVIVGFGHVYLGQGIPTALIGMSGPLIQYVVLPGKDKYVIMPVTLPEEEDEEDELML